MILLVDLKPSEILRKKIYRIRGHSIDLCVHHVISNLF